MSATVLPGGVALLLFTVVGLGVSFNSGGRAKLKNFGNQGCFTRPVTSFLKIHQVAGTTMRTATMSPTTAAISLPNTPPSLGGRRRFFDAGVG